MRAPNTFADQLEHASSLDGPGKVIDQVGRRLLGRSRLRDLLSGTPLGHPAHPAVVMVPLGLWTGGVIAGITGDKRAARRLTGLGLLGALPATATGLSDWLDTEGAEKRVGVAHLAANTAALTLFGASWRSRTRDKHAKGTLLALAGTVVAGAGGWLGGHLAYALGVGVDTNAFEGGPTDWTGIDDLSAPPAEGAVASGSVTGIGLVVSRDRSGPVALANRCSHRGGPLADGEVADGCVRCPWHGSEFDLRSGEVRRGPATVPQPAYEVRAAGEGLEARRSSEQRALRLNAARPGQPS
jgi:nitrite reductase/ring-hydroxylating ferredoxin subunit/uncharacterized membrane protein